MSAPIKICHITTAHTVFDVRIFQKELSSLSSVGYDTNFIAPHTKNETIKGIKIHALHGSINRISRSTTLLLKIFFRALKIKADIYHFHDPEILPIGILLYYFGKRIIYDTHEDLPNQLLGSPWLPKTLRIIISRFFCNFEAFAARRFVGIITTREPVRQRFSVLNRNTILIHNYPILDEFRKELTPASDSDNLILNMGGLSHHRCILEIVQALEKISKKHHIKAVFAGNSDSKAIEQKLSKLSGWQQIQYLGYVSRTETQYLLSRANMSIVLYSNQPNHLFASSNRFYESLAAGVPVIVPDFPFWKDMLSKYKCGVSVDTSNPDAIAKAIEFLLTHPEEAKQLGQNGRNAVRTSLNWEIEEEKLIKFYKSIL